MNNYNPQDGKAFNYINIVDSWFCKGGHIFSFKNELTFADKFPIADGISHLLLSLGSIMLDIERISTNGTFSQRQT
jgi:hypothetical protein